MNAKKMSLMSMASLYQPNVTRLHGRAGPVCMHFYVDNATQVPQYLVCSRVLPLAVGLPGQTGLQGLKS
jgi:hypothetical protein